ncbi:polysaccharide deacetylase family protein [Legionella sp. km772]|uniref:polysaccharide deacetylase family protein n=1 Tax=Legionella sp. km772 TaxID=2498111 RepID=UPI000F8CC613|nr:polysaccharide deacetylase family protein [Legionella sp. km772]RUR11305.1 polysaccharide deacetylase [Legionella sp. km772]
MLKRLSISFLLFTSVCSAQEREIAITIDDLPLVASRMNNAANRQRSTERFTSIVQAFEKYKVPATGFVIAGAIAKGQWAFLEQFKAAGLMLGNHTYSHYNLNTMSAEKYISDIARADKILAPILSTPKYFRYPYLAEGNKKTKPKVLAYLQDHDYIVAPVTIDSKDFAFNERLYKVPFRSREQYIKKLKPEYLAYIWKQTLRAEKNSPSSDAKQILLIHANLLNSYVLEDILEMYQKNGYKFISLTDALKNPAPPLLFPVKEKEDKAETYLENGFLTYPLS